MVAILIEWSRPESNWDQKFRKLPFYPIELRDLTFSSIFFRFRLKCQNAKKPIKKIYFILEMKISCAPHPENFILPNVAFEIKAPPT